MLPYLEATSLEKGRRVCGYRDTDEVNYSKSMRIVDTDMCEFVEIGSIFARMVEIIKNGWYI